MNSLSQHESLADQRPRIRPMVPEEARAVAGLINEAFIVEAFFKIGDRTAHFPLGSFPPHLPFVRE